MAMNPGSMPWRQRTGPTMSVPEAAESLGVGRALAYSACRRYRETDGAVGVPNIKVGRRILVLTAKLNEMLELGAISLTGAAFEDAFGAKPTSSPAARKLRVRSRRPGLRPVGAATMGTTGGRSAGRSWGSEGGFA